MDPDPVGSGLFWVTRIWIRIHILKTGSADPDLEKIDRIRNTDVRTPFLHYKIKPYNDHHERVANGPL